MDSGAIDRGLGKSLRVLPFVTIIVLALAYFSGGFSNTTEPTLVQSFYRWLLTFFIGVGPIIFIGFLFLSDQLRNREHRKIEINRGKLDYKDPFDLPSQVMHGYKITFLTGRDPTFTGLTGDLYKADDVATCSLNPEHVPPVASCECGFHAYKDIRAAKYELSINPGSFLIDVDLFGVGFAYTRGFKAESQVVNFISLPRRCMRCKIFAPKRFVTSYKFGFNSFAYWRWEFRCRMCSYNFKEADCLSPTQISERLKTSLQ